MSLQLLIDAAVNAGVISAPSPIAAAAPAAPALDFGDRVVTAYEQNFPKAVRRSESTGAPAATHEPFKAGSRPDFGDRVAAAYDRLFPPKGANR
jgi:hypothetical protein